ncbi:hypothetical protein SM19410_11120 [Xanthomonas hortorum pv. gardneri]|nr:hypothetical protein BJD10_00225 [Xanthomonas hortorum pv. gardneri]PPU38564.1 hypothetical protein XcyCFBP4188_18070 [Xanthomonas hortorum pv. cynarae]KLA96051.1 hypothetical protein SM17710_16600 [Xanthomonas hortorum pv. gardneri]KLA97017.1 hypothetical protein SM19410_11120 [Xanthomonas hortorum pv. gardneri]KLA99742.1 hypothetical protein SM18210_16240 [Xanthomonas hortorum pv. gardneri]
MSPLRAAEGIDVWCGVAIGLESSASGRSASDCVATATDRHCVSTSRVVAENNRDVRCGRHNFRMANAL